MNSHCVHIGMHTEGRFQSNHCEKRIGQDGPGETQRQNPVDHVEHFLISPKSH